MGISSLLSHWRALINNENENNASESEESQRIPTLSDLHDEKIFWKIYSSLEGGRSGHHDNSVSDNLPLQSALASAFSSGKLNKLAEIDEARFWKYFLYQANTYVVILQVANIVFLILMGLTLSYSHTIVVANEIAASYQFILADIFVWGMLSVVTISVLVIMRYFQDALRSVVSEGSRSIFIIWKKVGHFIFLVRVLSVALNLTLSVNNHFNSCEVEGGGSVYYDHTFQVNLIRACISGVETMIFSTLAFPLPWAILFCLVELIGQQGFRFLSCSSVLFGSGRELSFVSIGGLLAFIALYSIVGLNTSVILLSSRNFYQNTQRLDSATAEKRRFLDLLCTEIRSPLQHVVGAVSRITNSILPLSEESRVALLEIEQQVERETQLINLLSDNLLYLTRVEEGRALTSSETSNTFQKIVVSDLTAKLCRQHSVTEKDGGSFRDLISKILISDNDKNSATVVSSDLSLLTILIRNILFFGIVMLDDLREIESKGFINPFSASGSPPLQLTMHVSKDSKQDTDKRRGELSSHLVYSLECHALAPLPAQESELASITDADSANRSRMSDGDETLVDSFLMTNDNLSATSNQDDYSTILMTCIALTSRAAGSFSITRSRVEFSIQCSVKAENSPYESEVRRSDTHEHPRATREFPLTARDDNELDQRMRKIENIYVAVIADSSELASAMPSLLEGVGALSANVTILHDFDSTNQDDVDELCKVADICFVSSTAESVKLKESGFLGRVVLFSGSVVYLEEETVKKCDYVVHIPYMKADCDNLKTWMTSPIAAKTKYTREFSDSRSASRGATWFEFNRWLRSVAVYFHLVPVAEKPTQRQRRRTKRLIHNESSMLLSSNFHSSVHPSSNTLRQRYGANAGGSFSDYVKRKVRKGLQIIGGFSSNDEPVHTYPLGTKFNFVKGNVIFIDKFQHDVETTFCMWRLLNPTGFRVYHVFATDCANLITTLTYLAGVVFYSALGSPTTSGVCKNSYCYSSFWTASVPLFCIIVKLRGQIYTHILVPMNISLYCYWMAGSIILIVGFNIHLLDFYFYHHPNSYLWNNSYWEYSSPAATQKFSLTEFCSAPFGATTGLEILHVFLGSFSIISAGWTNHIPWPVSILSTFIALSRSFIIVLLINKFVDVDDVVQTLISATFLLFALGNITGQFYLEISLRNEFQSFRKTTFSHMFLELSLDALQKNLRKPLKNILESKEKFLRIVLDAVSTKRVEFSTALLADFDTLNMGTLLLRELYCELDLKDSLSQAIFYNSQPFCGEGKGSHESLYALYRNSNQAFLLTEQLLEIASCFSSFRSDFAVKVFVDVDPRLSLVRTNAKIFTSVIVNALARALKSIRGRLRGNENLRGYVQEISVTVRPLALSKSSSFFDMRLMNIEVTESNGHLLSKPKSAIPFWSKHDSLSEYPQDESEGFGSRVCREVVLFASKEAIYHTETPHCGQAFQYFHMQFTLPYQLHTCSGTAEALRRLKSPLGALFSARPTAVHVEAYENYHRRYTGHADDRVARRSGTRLSVLIVEREREHSGSRNNTLKDLFASSSWHYQSISCFNDWEESYLQCDCVLVDLNSICIMQAKDGFDSTGSSNDIDVPTLLRVLGYKMVIACIDRIVPKDEDPGSKQVEFDFTISSNNFSRTGIRELEDICNTFAISNLCWLDTME